MCKCLVHNTAYLYNVAVATVSKLVEKVDVLHPFLSCVTFLTWRTRVQFGCPTVSKPIQIQSLLTITLCGPVGACNCASDGGDDDDHCLCLWGGMFFVL